MKKVIISKNVKRNMQQVVYKEDGGSQTRHEVIDKDKQSFPYLPFYNQKKEDRR